MGMASPHPSQLWGTHFMKISLLLLCSSTEMLSQIPMGLQRAEPSQCTRLSWCFCTFTSPRNWEFHLGKDAHKMTAQIQIIFIFPCVQNAYQFLCVVFLLPVTETHPGSARKQQRKLQRQQTLTKSCPKASPLIHFLSKICFANATTKLNKLPVAEFLASPKAHGSLCQSKQSHGEFT